MSVVLKTTGARGPRGQPGGKGIGFNLTASGD